jgi:protein-disulfide isomerase
VSELTPDVGAHDHVLGPAHAPLTLVEYGDFECPHCGAAYPIVHEMLERMGNDVRFVYRHFPLKERHPHAQHAAEAAEAVAVEGKFWEMHAQMFQHQDALRDSDLVRYADVIGADVRRVLRELKAGSYAPRVSEDFMSGIRSGVTGTPAFFVNGERLDVDWTNRAIFEQALRSRL